MNIKINLQELKKILDLTPPEQNIMLIGKHGIGKSQILNQYFSKQGIKVVALFLGQMSDPGDLIGLPRESEDGKTDFLPPYWFPIDDEPIVLFLDELNRARPEILQTVMDLTLNRTLAGKKLPVGSRVISAVNAGEEYQLTDLDPSLVSRFNVYEFAPTVQEWLLWAEKIAELDSRIISFISEMPTMLDESVRFEETDNLDKNADRRAWHRVSNIIKLIPELEDIHKMLIAGIVGVRAANEFFVFLNNKKMLSAKEILTSSFDTIAFELLKYKTHEIAAINDSIFRFIETKNYSETQTKLIADNLNAYFDFLNENNFREGVAHFTTAFSSDMYPNLISFVVTKSPGMYKKITEFIRSI